jgi:hypothetical protein
VGAGSGAASSIPATRSLADIRIPGVEYHDVQLMGGQFDRWMMSHLSWFNYM